MTLSSLQFALLNSTTIENLSRKNVVWTLAVYMPEPPAVSTGFRTISFSDSQNLPEHRRSDSSSISNTIRTFAILHTKPGENPFDLGLFNNLKSVMGDHWYDWFFPFRRSPCCDHDRQEGQFAMGPVIDRIRREAGLRSPVHTNGKNPRRRHRRRRRRSHGIRDPRSEKLRVRSERVRSASGYNGEAVDLERG